MTQLIIEIRGTREEHRKLCSILRDAHEPTLTAICREIEDQLEEDAERSFDFLALEDLLF